MEVASSPVPFVEQETSLKPTTAGRKRKLASLGASPAPSDSLAEQQGNVLLAPTDKGVLDERPRLSISRPLTFQPIPNTGEPCLNTTEGHAFNRKLDSVAYRYVPAGLTPVGSPLPCRTIESAPTHVRVSWEDRSPFVKVSEDGLTLGGEKGFRSARCNVPVQEGKWYMEVKVEKGGGDGKVDNSQADGAHVRLGWGRREAPLNGPIGMDAYSYGYRDKTGDKVTLSRTKPYGQPFGTGDVIGLYISLPPRRQPDPRDPHDPAQLKRERIAIDLKGQEYFEILDYKPSQELIDLTKVQPKAKGPAIANPVRELTSPKKSATVKNAPSATRTPKKVKVQNVSRELPTLGSESFIAFFVNGVCQGMAYQDLYDYLQLRQTPAQIAERQKGARHREHGSGPRQHVENPFDDGWLGYYVFISLYGDARVRLNPGPDFEFTPPNNIDLACLNAGHSSMDMDVDTKERTWRPLHDRYAEFMKQQWELDVLEEAEAREAQAQQAVQDRIEAEKAALKEKRKAAQLNKKKKAKVDKESTPARQGPPTPSVDGNVPLSVDDRFGPAASGLADNTLIPSIHSIPDTPIEGSPVPPSLYRADRATPMSDLYYGDSGVGTPISGGPEETYHYDDASSSPGAIHNLGSEPGEFEDVDGSDAAGLRARIERSRRSVYEDGQMQHTYTTQELHADAAYRYPTASEYIPAYPRSTSYSVQEEQTVQHPTHTISDSRNTLSQFDSSHTDHRPS